MSALPEPMLEAPDFPAPTRAPERKIQFPPPVRQPHKKIQFPAKQSIGKSLHRSRSLQQDEEMQPVAEIEDLRSALDEQEEELREKQNEFARLKAETMERIRAARELEILLDARERLLDEREESIKAQQADLAVAREAPPTDTTSSATGYAGITDKSLAEQVAFLKEREAFIEESENKLFDKAQNLQEWETRLQQKEHDHDNA